MIKKTIRIINKLGLHARASMKLVNLASQFDSRIFILYKNHKANAKSIMNVMVLAATKGTEIELQIEGEDEQQALTAIEKLINDRFDESE